MEATSLPCGDSFCELSCNRAPTGRPEDAGSKPQKRGGCGRRARRRQRAEGGGWKGGGEWWQNARTPVPVRRGQASAAVAACTRWLLLDPGGSSVELRRPLAFQSAALAQMSHTTTNRESNLGWRGRDEMSQPLEDVGSRRPSFRACCAEIFRGRALRRRVRTSLPLPWATSSRQAHQQQQANRG